MIRLVDKKSRREICVGDRVTTFRGEVLILRNFRPGWKPGSTGRVGLADPDGTFHGEYFPGVIDAEVVTEVSE